MPGSKMVVLVPDLATRDIVRSLASDQPSRGLHASICVAHDDVDICVRDTRRALFDGPIAVLTRDDGGALRAIAAGADEAFSLSDSRLDATLWARLVERAELKCDLRRESAQRLASLSELEKLCALGRLVSGVAEELGGPLQGAQLALDALKRELEPLYAGMAQLRELSERDELPSSAALRAIVGRSYGGANTRERVGEVLSDVSETCSAISQVTRDLGLRELGLAADRQERPEYVDLRETLDTILRLFRRAAAKNTHIERDYSDELPEVLVPRARIAQVLISLVANALSNLRGEAQSVHRLRIQLRADDALVTVTVSDNGRGARAPALERMLAVHSTALDASARPANDAEGLELSVARAVMRSIGGELRPSGTVARPAPVRERRRSVLVVEPNRAVLTALSHLLREHYDVLLAQSGHEACALIATGTRPDAIVAACDDPDARKFVDWLVLEHAELVRRLLVTRDLGEPEDELRGLPWLEKPLEPAALMRAIEARFVAPLRKTRGSEPRLPRVAKGG
jgi:signal transduction histidine kinase